MTDYKNLKDVSQTAMILTVSESTVRELIRRGDLKAYRVGVSKAIRISQSEIDRYMEKCVIDHLEL